MKHIQALFIFFLLAGNSFLSAQEKQLTIDEAVVGVYTRLAPERISSLQWRPGYDQYSFVRGNSLWVSDVVAATETELCALTVINKALAARSIDTLRSFPSSWWVSGNAIRFYASANLVMFDVVNHTLMSVISYPEAAENIELSPDGNLMAYTTGNNLNIMGADGNEVSVTSDRNLEVVYGTSVHRHEFGIEKGIFWSPTCELLAFYRKDESKVGNYPLVDITQPIATVDNIKYPMAGTDSEEVTLGVYNLKTQKTIYLETGMPADQYLTNVAWHPDGKIIYVAVLNREQNHMKMNAYDAVTGKFIKTLFEERNTRYVEPLNPALFVPGHKDRFIWQSRRSGYNHLYLYNTDGQLLKQLSTGNWEVAQVYGFSGDAKYLFINAGKESPICFDIYRIEIESAKISRLSNDKGTHQAIIHPSGNYLIDVCSNTKTPARYNLCDGNGKLLRTLLDSKNPLAEYKLGNMTMGTIKAADGTTDLYYRLITPPGFDKSKKYPCIVYVYGGPHAQLVTDRWMGGAAGWDYYMAQNGYVVFTLDNRGSANRGMEFESVIHRNLGVAETADQMKGVDFLRSLGYVDMDRIGVHGWSYGGFMTITMMTAHNDVFKVGVAGGPVIDWKYYEVMYGERYMDMPEENPNGYANASLITKTNQLTGRLLIVHGAIDDVVVWQNSLDFINSCINNKVLVDYFVYPRHEHNVRGYDRIHLMRMVSRYFDDHLK
ncbi:MAG TPA: DPP IV N-terminal domain-containing protein [Bacteroidales bacterium]|nr:DPP IV N-terminal domain-containing protein [Bacteroidales bacterium]